MGHGQGLRPKAQHALEQYLLDHEEDIASGSNDFADLRLVFVDTFRRAPQWTDHLGYLRWVDYEGRERRAVKFELRERGK